MPDYTALNAAADKLAADAAAAQKATDDNALAAKQAELDAYKAAHPDVVTPPPPPPPPPSGWTVSRTLDLTTEPAGTAYTNGVRANTDQSYNLKSRATYGPNGLTITATRANGRIESADVMMHGVVLPADSYALEFDCDLQGLGSGMFPAAWERGLNGQGEADIFEYVGSNAGNTNPSQSSEFPMKSTVILTGSGGGYNQGNKAFGIPLSALGGKSYEGKHTWRYEKTPAGVTVYIDGAKVGGLTAAQVDAQARSSSYSWAKQFGNNTFYPRFTFQVGNGTSSHMAGPVPASWTKSTMTISRMAVYVPA